ncbi:membrane protein [Ectopseudomonas oleovorans]|nr:membrane protein [Pseudomonas oleovorans]
MKVVLDRIPTLIALLRRYPGLVALFGFCSGVASFLLVDRQAYLAKVLGVVLLVSWVWLILENLLRERIARRFGFELPLPLLRYGTQMIHQESLFFVLPFFFITTTWNSGQLLFSGLLAIAALASITDPIYYRWLAPRRWLLLIFHSLALFAVMLTALPIIFHLSTPQSYRIALLIATLLALPSLPGLIGFTGWRRIVLLAALPLAMASAGWVARAWVPPATLWLTEVAISDRFDGEQRTPGESLQQISPQQLRDDGLYAYTSINAPRGLNERIYHVWQHNGREVDRIALDINGGRKEGYRAWTHKLNFPASPEGRWQVRVVTEAGQMIGVLRFDVVAATAK